MNGAAATSQLYRAAETVRTFLGHCPSLSALLASRTGQFDRLHAILPSTAAAGEALDLTVQAWDGYERLLDDFEGTLRVDSTDPAATLPDRVRFAAGNGGVTTEGGLRFETPGVQYLTLARAGGDERFVSNPVRVTPDEPDQRLYWGDIHLHSRLSDGTGSIEKGLRFGRDAMALDVVSYTDHDTMGFFIPPSLQRRRMHRRYFDRMKRVAEAFDDPGEFVTLFAYEWTQQPNVGGHLNVYFDSVAGAPLFDSLAPESDSYEKLWERLREWNDDTHEAEALTVPHHPAESMYPFDFSAVDYDDELAPLVEVYSQWGSSEKSGREGNPFPVLMGQGEADEPGHHVQDALRMGHRVGMLASADYHGPHPGHSFIHARPHLPSLDEWLEDGLGWANIWRIWDEQSYPGGLTAFRAPELSREAIFDSLRNRRVYGTTQPHRILVDLRVDGVRVGDDDSTVTVDEPEAQRRIEVEVAGTAPVERVEVVKNNDVWRAYEGTDDPGAGLDAYVVDVDWTDDDPVTGMSWDRTRGTDADAYYVRVTQAAPDGEYTFPGTAWAGPVWVEATE